MTAPVIRGVNHIGITVPDIEAAKSFLVEAFGGEVIYQSFGPQDPPRQGPEFERAVGAFPGTVVRAQAMVKIGTGPDIELFEMHGPEQAAADPGERLRHHALWSLHRRHRRMRSSASRRRVALPSRRRGPFPYATEKGLWKQGLLLPHALGHDDGIHHPPDRMAYRDQTDLRRWQDDD